LNPGDVLAALVFFAAIYKVVLYQLLPAVYRLLAGWEMDLDDQILPSEVAEVYILEGVSYVCWMLGFAWAGTRLAPAATSAPPARFSVSCILEDASQLLADVRESGLGLLLFLCGGYLFLVFRSLSSGLALTDPVVAGYLWPVQPLVMWSGPICGIFLVAIGPRRAGAPSFLVGLVTSGVALWLAAGTGVRGTLAGPAIWGLFLFVFVHRNRLLLAVAGILLLSVGVFHNSMISQRSHAGWETLDVSERLTLLSQDRENQRYNIDENQSVMDAAVWRFGEASRLSTAFLRMVDRGYSAGWSPIATALYAPLPRLFFPDKPEPGSVDGTRQTIGVHAIQGEIRGNPYCMCEYFTGLHAYWELGPLGLVLFSALAGVYIRTLASTLRRLGIAALPVLDLFFKPWWMEPKLWMSEIVIQIVQYILPLLAVWMIIQWTIGIIFRRPGVRPSNRSADGPPAQLSSTLPISSAPNAPTGLK